MSHKGPIRDRDGKVTQFQPSADDGVTFYAITDGKFSTAHTLDKANAWRLLRNLTMVLTDGSDQT